MTPKERVMNRLAGKPVDKIPNLNIVMSFAAKYAGVKYGEFCTDYRVRVGAMEKTTVDFGLDVLTTMSDAYGETHDYGAKIRYPEDDLPICESPLIRCPEDANKLKRWNPLESTRMLDRVKGLELYKKNWGNHYPIVGWVEGPFAEFADLTSLNEAMMMLYTEPAFLQESMELITEQAIDCAIAQLEAGADIIGVGDAAVSLINPEHYYQFVWPLEKRIIQAIQDSGGKSKLHICGNTTHILENIIATGADIIDLDYMVDFTEAIRLSEGKCSISGNFDPVTRLLQSTPDEVRATTKYFMECGNSTSIISAGCEVPKETPPENLKAVDMELCFDN